MNERIRELAEQATKEVWGNNPSNGAPEFEGYEFDKEKFAELLIRDCIDSVLNSDDKFYMDLEGWDIGGPNHSAWTRGVLDSVGIIRERFGVELEL